MPAVKKATPETDYWAKIVRDACQSPYHKPPMHQVFSPGEQEHMCPACGFKTKWFQSRITYNLTADGTKGVTRGV